MMKPIPYFVAAALEMQIPNDLRDSIVYIGIETESSFIPTGTGFLVNYGFDEQHHFICVVTAKHVTAQAKESKLAIRLNRKSGEAQSVVVNKSNILEHKDENIDLAVVPINLGVDVFHYKTLNINREHIERQRKNYIKEIDIGESVVSVGLYTSHHGASKNMPVVRMGNIAAMPEEPVRVHGGGYVEAYLIEIRSIAGISGSPVYVNPPDTYINSDGELFFVREFPYLPIGVLVGYHVVETKEDQVQVPQFHSNDMEDNKKSDLSADERNTGFGVVIPIERIIDIMEGDTAQGKMKEVVESTAKKSPFRPASALIKSSPEPLERAPESVDQERFNRLLGAAVKPPKSSD